MRFFLMLSSSDTSCSSSAGIFRPGPHCPQPCLQDCSISFRCSVMASSSFLARNAPLESGFGVGDRGSVTGGAETVMGAVCSSPFDSGPARVGDRGGVAGGAEMVEGAGASGCGPVGRATDDDGGGGGGGGTAGWCRRLDAGARERGWVRKALPPLLPLELLLSLPGLALLPLLPSDRWLTTDPSPSLPPLLLRGPALRDGGEMLLHLSLGVPWTWRWRWLLLLLVALRPPPSSKLLAVLWAARVSCSML